MFTLTDIRDIAIQIERNGEETYRQAAEKIEDQAVAQALTWMAEEEARHANWFKQFRSAKTLSAEEQKIEAMGRKLLQEMIEGQTFSLERKELLDSDNLEQLVEQSLGFEQDTILFYEFLHSLIEDEPTKKHLSAIIEEERRHYQELAQMQP